MKTKYKIFLLNLILLGAAACKVDREQFKENELNVIAEEMSYSQKELHLNKNTPYRLRFENKGKILHDWNVSEILVKNVVKTKEKGKHDHHHSNAHDPKNLHIAADSNSTSEIAFTILESGAYEYYCSVPGHKEAGMKGTIFVHN